MDAALIPLFSQITNKGAALNIEEYVPEKMPTNNATTNHLIDSPPNNIKAKSIKRTVNEVFNERTNVCTSDSFTTDSKSTLPEVRRRFSRTLSKTTIVS